MPFDLKEKRGPLHTWICKTLIPIYKADRTKLADYIVSLIEHANGSSLSKIPKGFFVSDLADFLTADVNGFVDQLVQYLRRLEKPTITPIPSMPSAPAVVKTQPQHQQQHHHQHGNNHRHLPASGGGQSRKRSTRDRGSSRHGDHRDDHHHRDSRDRGRDNSRSSRRRRHSRSRSHSPIGRSKRPREQHHRAPSPNSRSETSLVVAGIPPASCSMGQVSQYFGKYGTLEACRVDSASQKAFITFRHGSEAKNAISDEQAVMGNRFIKIYYDRKKEGEAAAAAPYQRKRERPKPKREKLSEKIGPEELERRKQERAQQVAELKAVKKKREELRKTQLEEMQKLMQMIEGASGKKKEILMEQMKIMSSSMQASLSVDRKVLGVQSPPARRAHLQQTVSRLEAKVAATSTKLWKRKQRGNSSRLDNRPRTLNLTGLPVTNDEVSASAVIARFKTKGQIDEVNLEATPPYIIFTKHEDASKAHHAKAFRVGETTLQLSLEWIEKVPTAAAVVSRAPVTQVVGGGVVEEEDEDEEDDEEQDEDEKWKR